MSQGCTYTVTRDTKKLIVTVNKSKKALWLNKSIWQIKKKGVVFVPQKLPVHYES